MSVIVDGFEIELGWAGPHPLVEGIARRAGTPGQWEPPHVERVARDVVGIDSDGRYETGRVYKARRRR